MKILKIFTSRLVITGLLIALQVIWIGFFVFRILTYTSFITYLFKFISLLVAAYIIAKDEDSGYKLIWITLIAIMPIFGGLLYLIIGNKKPSRGLRKAYDKEELTMQDSIYPNELLDEIDNDLYRGQMKYLTDLNFPIYKNNQVVYFDLGDKNYPELIKALKEAKSFIFMEYFIVAKGEMFDEILDILKQKVSEGVEVRFMYDDVGSLTTLPRNYYRKLQAMGIQAIAYNPFVPFISVAMNNRDHRKITVIDGTIGFCGGFNLADEYINKKERFGHWKDTAVMIKGDGVWSLTRMFLSSWHVATKTSEDIKKYHPQFYDNNYKGDGYIIPYGDSPLDNETVGINVYLNMINQAKNYIYIDTPYLIINEKLQTALTLAVKRGVDVRILTPGIPDKKIVYRITRSYYGELIQQGIRIYEYTPGFVHAKNFVCDDVIATVGTINLDYRSLYLHFECGVMMYQTSSIKEIKEDFFNTINVSKEIKYDDVKKGRFKGIFETFLRVFAPLL